MYIKVTKDASTLLRVQINKVMEIGHKILRG